VSTGAATATWPTRLMTARPRDRPTGGARTYAALVTAIGFALSASVDVVRGVLAAPVRMGVSPVIRVLSVHLNWTGPVVPGHDLC
jgi:hypothetical protein